VSRLALARPLLAGVLLGLAACSSLEPPAEVARLDSAAYVRDVHPYVAARCATLDCHGMAGRPLRIYSELGLRARAELRGHPLTLEEQLANVQAVEGLDPGVAADEHLLLRKPLALALGGIAHKGKEIWLERSDPGYVCLRGWLVGAPDAAACAAAYEPVKIPDAPAP
jgi:hypothetical protein